MIVAVVPKFPILPFSHIRSQMIMHSSIFIPCLAVSVATFVAAQFETSGDRDASTNINCTLWQDWPDTYYPELGETCASISEAYYMDEQDFIRWNPIVGENCEYPAQGNAYCVYVDEYDENAAYDAEEGDGATSTTSSWGTEEEWDSESGAVTTEEEAETRGSDLKDSAVSEDLILGEGALDGESGSPITEADCTRTGPGQYDCETTASLWGITEEDFIAMNPSVGEGCSDIIRGQYYCVQARTHPLLDESTTPECTQHTDYPTTSDLYREAQGDTCKSFSDFWFIRESDFLKWNPVLGDDCENFEQGRRYCVWVDGAQSYYDHILGNETTTGMDGEASSTATAGESTSSKSETESASTTASPSETESASATASPSEEGSAGLRLSASMWLVMALGTLGCFIMV